MKTHTFLFLFLLVCVVGCGAGNFATRFERSRSYLDNRQYDIARQEILSMIRDYPDKPEPYYLLGLLSFAQKQYGESIVHFNRAEALGLMVSYDFCFTRGCAYYLSGTMENAEKCFTEATAKRSTGDAWKYLGLARFRLEKYEGAVEAFRSASSLEKDGDALFAFGMSLYHIGMTAEALDVFQLALKGDPDNPTFIFQTANLLLLNDQFQESVSLYETIPTESRYYRSSLYNSAEALLHMGEYDRAVNTLEGFLDMFPDDMQALYTYGAALIKNGDLNEAADVLGSLADTDDFRVQALYDLGIVHYRLGEYEAALTYYREAVESNPDNPEFRYAYGLALAASGNTEEASGQMKEVLLLVPGHSDAAKWMKNYDERK